MGVWTDGLASLGAHGWVVFMVLCTIFLGGMAVVGVLRKTLPEGLTEIEMLSLGVTGWIFPAVLWGLVMLACSFWLGQAWGTLAAILFACALIWLGWKKGGFFSRTSLMVFIFLAISIILRLAYVRGLALPMYFDSAEHYRVIQYFLSACVNGRFPVGEATAGYYHVGYHLLVSALACSFKANGVEVMLVFGQVVLALMPLSFFMIVQRETKSISAGAFACLMAGFGWHMPSHLVNWGKYPALFGLMCVLFVLNAGYLLSRNGFEKRPWLLAVFAAASALAHTRMLVIFSAMALSALLTWGRNRMGPVFRPFANGAALTLLLIEIFYIHERPFLSPLLFGYLHGAPWMLFAAFVLFVFSLREYPTATFFLLSFTGLLLAGLFISMETPWGGRLTLLDRPYAQALLFIPLSLISGLGLGGVLTRLGKTKRTTWVLAATSFAFVIANATLNISFYPSGCCFIVTRDDIAAITWMDGALSSTARVLIASDTLRVTSNEEVGLLTGTDGGIWVEPLIAREIVPFDTAADFRSPKTLAEVCALEVDYVYVGGMPKSFDASQLVARSAWYQEDLSLPQAKVYRVIGCE